jgi:glycine cleavage system H protein
LKDVATEAVSGFEFPRGRYYERSQHLWVQPGAENAVVVGVDSLGLEALGELAYVSLQGVGSRVERGEPLGTLEAAKMTTDVASPVSGRIMDRNEAVLKDPLLVNRDPYGKGWLVRIEPTSWESESSDLVSGRAIVDWAASEVKRYRAEKFID